MPSRQPAFTILVVIDTPRAGGHYGGDVAAPVFKRIAEAALQQIGRAADDQSDAADRRHRRVDERCRAAAGAADASFR